jgi:hypothetical protein
MDAGTPLDRASRYLHPVAGAWGRFVERLVGSSAWRQLRRWIAARWPMPALVSDVVDVAYMSWWVDIQALPVPPAGYHYPSWEGRTPFTILSYRHGHFGPALAGPFRRLFPSPLQSNWRCYVRREDDPNEAAPTVLFLRNVMDSLPHVVGARLFSDAMQPQLAHSMQHRCDHVIVSTRIVPGDGGAPALLAELGVGDPWPPGTSWVTSFGSRDAAVRFLACQDAAVSIAPDGATAFTVIALPVDLSTVVPLTLRSIHCPMLEQVGADPADALCFLLPRVPFGVVSERLL